MLYPIRCLYAVDAGHVGYTPDKMVQIVDDRAMVKKSQLEWNATEIALTEGTADLLVDTSFDGDTRLMVQEVTLKGRFHGGCEPLWLVRWMLAKPDLVYLAETLEGLLFLIGDDGLPPVAYRVETRHAELTSANNGDWLSLSLRKETAVRAAYLY